jgi:hypothetical protein
MVVMVCGWLSQVVFEMALAQKRKTKQNNSATFLACPLIILFVRCSPQSQARQTEGSRRRSPSIIALHTENGT